MYLNGKPGLNWLDVLLKSNNVDLLLMLTLCVLLFSFIPVNVSVTDASMLNVIPQGYLYEEIPRSSPVNVISVQPSLYEKASIEIM